jgi:thymidine phosphorylase
MNMPDTAPRAELNTLKARRLGIDTHQEVVLYLRQDCHLCRSEGVASHARVQVESRNGVAVATLNFITSGMIHRDEAGLSEAAWRRLGLEEGDTVLIAYAPALESLSHVRAKIYGRRLEKDALRMIVDDVVAGRYADVHLAAFVTACAGAALDVDEVTSLTEAMVGAGRRIDWGRAPIADKHSVGGLPGNRTTPIVVAIAAACGLTIPKTSSRAITSPSGTADTMETLTRVDLDLAEMRKVVEQEGGCLAWGGAVDLSPADDVLIRVERALDIDSEGQLVASVLSKKIAAGATHVLIDMPVGPTAKVRTHAEAERLSAMLVAVGKTAGLQVRVLQTDGLQPVGSGIGPALEARDVLQVLQGKPGAPSSLRARALMLAGALLELAGACEDGAGKALADAVLRDGRAWRKFAAICAAQGGLREPPIAPYTQRIEAPRAGIVAAIDNRVLARIAKLAGAPDDKAAGVELHVRVGAAVEPGRPLYTLHAESAGELAYALDFVARHRHVIAIADTLPS